MIIREVDRDFRSCLALIGTFFTLGSCITSLPVSRHNLRARTIEVRRLLYDEASPVNSTRTHSATSMMGLLRAGAGSGGLVEVLAAQL